jgi:hypothetical protein
MTGADRPGGNAMRGFGGIFPLVPEGDMEGIKRSSELLEERLELAQGNFTVVLACMPLKGRITEIGVLCLPPALPVEALAGVYSATDDFSDASVTHVIRSAATSRQARYALEEQGRVRAFSHTMCWGPGTHVPGVC